MSVISIKNHIQAEQSNAVPAIFQKIATGKSISEGELALIANCVDNIDLQFGIDAERL
jgi:hypothetical protein